MRYVREILFRGKRTDNGEWVYGYYIKADVSPKDDIHKDVHCIIPYGKLTKTLISDNYIYEVVPKTVGQYTGLDDKNVSMIFEGDVVKLFGMKGIVINSCGSFGISFAEIDYDLLESNIPFNNNAYFCFNDNYISLWELWWNYQQDDEPLEVVEVIGNIYDNPKLLRGE